MTQSSCIRAATCLLIALPALLAAQGAAARGRGSTPAPAVHEWLSFTPAEIETADSLESMIVLPNGRHAVLPADSGRVYLTVRGIIKRISADSGLAPVKLDYVSLFDTKGASYQSTAVGMGFYPALKEARQSFTFRVPRGAVAARLRFGAGEADLRGLKSRHVPTSLRN